MYAITCSEEGERGHTVLWKGALPRIFMAAGQNKSREKNLNG
jgi:hypothetical protein